MVNGLHLYSTFIQSAVQFMPLIHPFTHTFTHQRRLAAMQGTNQLVRSNWGLGVLLRDTSTRPGWDRTGNPPTARRQLSTLNWGYQVTHPIIIPLIIMVKSDWKVVLSYDKIMFSFIYSFNMKWYISYIAYCGCGQMCILQTRWIGLGFLLSSQ